MTARPVAHYWDVQLSPIARIGVCSCGFRTSVPRTNALGATAKLNAAMRRHFESAHPEEIRCTSSPK